ncbi:MAG TPA: threonine--tRNA ligase [Tepidisphaeraceae bacterium]|jgi:threonyl-tRNA synthetase|nr:threonine--tRNA ligase [Tepidisphaeraceae bacterium]
MASVKLPDGSIKDIPDGGTVGQLADAIGRRLGQAAIVGKVDGKLVDLSHPLTGAHEVQIITDRDPEGLMVMRHSTAHVLAQALRHLYGTGVQYTIGPVIENGFFYDFEFPNGFSQEDLPKVEAEMQKIIDQKLPFKRDELPPPRAKERLHQENQRFKDEIIDELATAGETTVSTYQQGDFLDLCRGPHVPNTGKIKAFKLLSVAGAYWRGDEKREQLTRIYGTSFFDKKELDAHLKQLEEAKERDHRVIGQKLGLFTIDDQVGPGLILWKPKGAMVRTILQNFLQEELFRRGYQMVYTPHIGKVDLYKTSGHYPYYKESQFPLVRFLKEGAQALLDALEEAKTSGEPLPPEREKELVAKAGLEKGYPWDVSDLTRRHAIVWQLALSGEDYLLKPMNCPHHIKIYASEPRSYRDLPLRLAEFGTVYRFEQSGELSGMTRVRGFTQDDAHIFCTHEQVKGEFRATVELVQFVFHALGFKDVQIRLSKHDPNSPKFAGNKEVWLQAEQEIREVLTDMKMDFVEAAGEAAFYGPKVDFLVRDVIGRKWQLGTVQLDYVLPERFQITYTGSDNRPHRPVMIHRAPFGSMERFMGILIEHFGGSFPLWLAPVQVAVLPISEKFNEYAGQVIAALRQDNLRVEANLGADKIGAKIRDASLQKIPYQLIVGEKEAQAGEVSVRALGAGDVGKMTVSEFIQRCQQEIATHGVAHAVAAQS